MAAFVVTRPRCDRAIADGAWCRIHDAYWPLRDRDCRQVKAWRRRGLEMVVVKPRRWHPMWWWSLARALARSIKVMRTRAGPPPAELDVARENREAEP